MNKKLSAFEKEQFLRNVELPFEKTSSYTPMPHGSMIDTVVETLYKYGMTVTNRTYSMNKFGTVMTGRFGINHRHVTDHEMGLEIAFQNSVDKSVSAKVAIGAQVFICANGMISAEHAFKRKHTGGVIREFQTFLQHTIQRSSDYFEQLVGQRDEMKNIQVDKKLAAELVGRMFIEQNLITATQVGIIKRELVGSDNFAMFNSDGTSINDYTANLWYFYNNLTEALKTTAPRSVISAHVENHKFLEEQFALA